MDPGALAAHGGSIRRFGHVTTAQPPPWSNQLPRAQPDNALTLSSVLAVVKLVERRMSHGHRSIRLVGMTPTH